MHLREHWDRPKGDYYEKNVEKESGGKAVHQTDQLLLQKTIFFLSRITSRFARRCWAAQRGNVFLWPGVMVATPMAVSLSGMWGRGMVAPGPGCTLRGFTGKLCINVFCIEFIHFWCSKVKWVKKRMYVCIKTNHTCVLGEWTHNPTMLIWWIWEERKEGVHNLPRISQPADYTGDLGGVSVLRALVCYPGWVRGGGGRRESWIGTCVT